MSTTAPETKSARLIKAQQLIEQSTLKDPVLAVPDADLVTESALPDTFWSNGHLQEGGNYVTRWARGVKVAEPLVRYDPVAAEKLLFRQPAKVRHADEHYSNVYGMQSF